jgi:sulfur-carrier protein adenylyltransferase/sulfurtransferase
VEEIAAAAEGRPIVVQCKMGGRSAKATQLLRERGLARAQNLKGGILAWIDQVDPKQPKY